MRRGAVSEEAPGRRALRYATVGHDDAADVLVDALDGRPLSDALILAYEAGARGAGERPPAAGWVCCGLDEVGRGALAGPLVAAAVILADDVHRQLGPLAPFLRDSKTVPPARRVEIAERLRALALALEIVVIPVTEINARGIGWANREAFRHLIGRVRADEYVVDGRVLPPAPRSRAHRVRCLVDADALVPAVSAASLVAKVYRDHLMAEMHQRYPAFGWERNAGYGTPAHLTALHEHGPCCEHRSQFVATALGLASKPRGKRKAQDQSAVRLFPDD